MEDGIIAKGIDPTRAIGVTRMTQEQYRAAKALRDEPSFRALLGWMEGMLDTCRLHTIYAEDPRAREVCAAQARMLDGMLLRLGADSLYAATGAAVGVVGESPASGVDGGPPGARGNG